MRGLYFDETLKYIDDLPMPERKEHESLIKILMAGICNTDREVLKGYKKGFKGVLGHEFVGIVEDSDDKSLIGKRVVGELNAGCKKCLYCKTNREKHCVDRKIIGMTDKDGCFAEYMTIDTELLHLVPDELKTEVAVFTEPLAAALEITDGSHIKPSDNIAVIGDGRLAFMISQVLSLTGADITAFGRHDDKLEKFSSFANVSTEPSGSFEKVIEATGSPSGIKTAISLVRSQGEIIIKSTYADEATLNLSEVVVREIRIRGSRCGPFAPALKLLKRELVTLPEIDLYDIKDFDKAFSSHSFKSGFDFRK